MRAASPLRALGALGLALLAGLAGCGTPDDPLSGVARLVSGAEDLLGGAGAGPAAADRGLLARVLPGSGVAVPPLAGLPGTTSAKIAAAVAGALLEADIPAFAVTHREGGEILAGAARFEAGGEEGVVRLAVDWTYAGPGDRTPARLPVAARIVLPRDGNGAIVDMEPVLLIDSSVRAEIAEATARALAAEIARRRGDAGPVREVAPERMRIALLGIAGAPGDGNQALARALAEVLATQGIDLKSAPEGPSGAGAGLAGIEAEVAVEPRADGSDAVAISWRVRDRQGVEVGLVEQANAVPHGRLEGPWGEIATLAAFAAADGLLPLLARAGAASPRAPQASDP